jgi:hypothetical protein
VSVPERLMFSSHPVWPLIQTSQSEGLSISIRSRKVRCDGVHPICNTCSSSSAECVWPLEPNRRGRKSARISTSSLSQQRTTGSQGALATLIPNRRSQLYEDTSAAERRGTEQASQSHATLQRDPEPIGSGQRQALTIRSLL